MFDFSAATSIESLLTDTIKYRFAGKIALVSSFGTQSAVILHMVSGIDKAVPVVFLDTLKLFPETLAYREDLVARLGLSDVRSIRPSAKHLSAYDPDGRLWQTDTDLCCAIRKTYPLDQALEGMVAWITGRKRAQGGHRADLQMIDTGADGRVTVNPLAFWDDAQIEAYFVRHNLPRHPLQTQGYASVGCATCTQRPTDPADKRSGRWAGSGKTECGIHLPRQHAVA